MPQVLWPFNRSLIQVEGRRVLTIALRRTAAVVPTIGLRFDGCDGGTAAAGVESALALGFRHFDFCHADGTSQLEEVGSVFGKWLASGVRADLYVSFKTRYYTPEDDGLQGDLTGAIQRLQCGYLDMVSPQWPADVTSPSPSIDHRGVLGLCDKISEGVPPKGLLTRHMGVGNLPTGYLAQQLLRDSRESPDGVHHEMSLAMQVGGLRATCLNYDMPFFAQITVPEVMPKLALQACEAKGITPVELTAKFAIAEGALAVVRCPETADELKSLLVATSVTEDNVLLLKQREREVLRKIDQGLGARTLGTEFPEIWKAGDL